MNHDVLISKLGNVRMMAAGRLSAVDVDTIDEVIGFLAERQLAMPSKRNRDQTVAVDPDYFWRPMCDCPIGVKVQLLGTGGVATYGNYIRGDCFWTGWAPLPKERKAS